MSNERESQGLLPLRRMATRLGVPSRWLKEQAESGKVPGLQAGNRWLFVPDEAMDAVRALAATKNRRLDVGVFTFVVFSESGKFRYESEWFESILWDEELAEDWRINLDSLKRMEPLSSDDARRLRDAERWMDRKGGDA